MSEFEKPILGTIWRLVPLVGRDAIEVQIFRYREDYWHGAMPEHFGSDGHWTVVPLGNIYPNPIVIEGKDLFLTGNGGIVQQWLSMAGFQLDDDDADQATAAVVGVVSSAGSERVES